MTKKRKLLIATTNEGKLKEIIDFLGDLPFEFVGLKDVGNKLKQPEETEARMEGNALLKAKYYGEKTKLLTLADDSGICIDALNGWPGVNTNRATHMHGGEVPGILAAMRDIPRLKRTALARSAMSVYDPKSNDSFIAVGEIRGRILAAARKKRYGFGFDPIFLVEEVGKTYAELTPTEKNAVSHRGKALTKIKHFLQKQYGAKQLIAPIAIIIKDSKILLNQRHDPHNPRNHNRWEFPGGGVELGETVHENLRREVKEETGYEIEVIKLIDYIVSPIFERPHSLIYQVFLLPYVCRIVRGTRRPRAAEVSQTRWVLPNEVPKYKLVGKNKDLYRAILPELKKIMKENKF